MHYQRVRESPPGEYRAEQPHRYGGIKHDVCDPSLLRHGFDLVEKQRGWQQPALPGADDRHGRRGVERLGTRVWRGQNDGTHREEADATTPTGRTGFRRLWEESRS